MQVKGGSKLHLYCCADGLTTEYDLGPTMRVLLDRLAFSDMTTLKSGESRLSMKDTNGSER